MNVGANVIIHNDSQVYYVKCLIKFVVKLALKLG
jgi:hypothetical protein